MVKQGPTACVVKWNEMKWKAFFPLHYIESGETYDKKETKLYIWRWFKCIKTGMDV